MLPELEQRYRRLRGALIALDSSDVGEVDIANLELMIGDMESLLKVLSPSVEDEARDDTGL